MNLRRYTEIEELDLESLLTTPYASPFDSFDANEFENFLRTGLEGYFFEKQGAWAFSIAADWIAQAGSLPDGLNALYRSLQSKQRGEFRAAISNLLASLPENTDNVPLFEQLLVLAPMLPAPEILRVLPQKVRGFFGSNPDLFQSSLFTVARLAAPRSDATVECLHTLISSPQYTSGYAGIALLALCQADDTKLVDHMELLRKSFHALFAQEKTERARLKFKWAWAGQLLEVLPSCKHVADALPFLKYFDRKASDGCDDSWLIDGLLGGAIPHLLCETITLEMGTEVTELRLRYDNPSSVPATVRLDFDGAGDLIWLLRQRKYIQRQTAEPSTRTEVRASSPASWCSGGSGRPTRNWREHESVFLVAIDPKLVAVFVGQRSGAGQSPARSRHE